MDFVKLLVLCRLKCVFEIYISNSMVVVKCFYIALLKEHDVLNPRVRYNFLVGRGDGKEDSRLRIGLWNHKQVKSDMNPG